MNNILFLYAGNLTSHAFNQVFNGKSAFGMAVEQAKQFPGVNKTVILFPADMPENFPAAESLDIQTEKKNTWTKKSILDKIAELQEGYDLAYFVFADCPFLDPSLAGKIAERHIRFASEYSYADGWPYGLAPEILSPGTAAILAKILGDEDGQAGRDMLFSVIQKDINAFDIETEISALDLRCHRISLCADSKRNLLLLENFYRAAGGNIPSSSAVEKIVAEKPEILRTLPSFYPVQVFGGCPQKCAICPYPLYTDAVGRKDFMDSGKFETLLDRIIDFSEDAVIDLSLWGELSLHPEKMKLIEAVLARRELSLIIETSGLGWETFEPEKCLELLQKTGRSAEKRFPPPISWIVSLDTSDPRIYAQIRGAGFSEAEKFTKKLLSLFPGDCYVQAVRFKGSEDDTEKFYRYWKDASPNGEKNIIIQKYDDFCGALEKKQASDISPVIRQCCWHIMRDFPVLISGDVPLCRENLSVLNVKNSAYSGASGTILGNVFTDSLDAVWRNGDQYYREQCKKNYTGLCENCDEYYTYNF